MLLVCFKHNCRHNVLTDPQMFILALIKQNTLCTKFCISKFKSTLHYKHGASTFYKIFELMKYNKYLFWSKGYDLKYKPKKPTPYEGQTREFYLFIYLHCLFSRSYITLILYYCLAWRCFSFYPSEIYFLWQEHLYILSTKNMVFVLLVMARQQPKLNTEFTSYYQG